MQTASDDIERLARQLYIETERMLNYYAVSDFAGSVGKLLLSALVLVQEVSAAYQATCSHESINT